MGEYFMRQLRGIPSPLIREVRGRGLLIGVELVRGPVSARQVCEGLMRHGVLTKDTHYTVIRFAPPLIVARVQVDEAVAALRAVLADFGSDMRNAA